MSRRYLKIFKTKPITLSLGVTVSTGFQNNKRNKALSLDQLGVQHRTDKASTLLTSGHHTSGHNYLVKYDHFLEHLKLRKDAAAVGEEMIHMQVQEYMGWLESQTAAKRSESSENMRKTLKKKPWSKLAPV